MGGMSAITFTLHNAGQVAPSSSPRIRLLLLSWPVKGLTGATVVATSDGAADILNILIA
jgi:hypothetical protein